MTANCQPPTANSLPSVRILRGDCTRTLRRLAKDAPQSVQCVVTSPPYWGLRDYGVPATNWPEVTFSPMPGLPPLTIPRQTVCLGLERDPWAFIAHLVHVFRLVRATMRPDGVAWVNMGDSYASNAGGYDTTGSRAATSSISAATRAAVIQNRQRRPASGLKPKDLVGQPWRLAFALQADGWFLRQEIIWSKPNPMPETIRDRCTKAHEQLFLLSLSERYFWDESAMKEPSVTDALAPNNRWDRDLDTPPGQRPQKRPSRTKVPGGWDTRTGNGGHGSFHKDGRNAPEYRETDATTRNARSVWTVPTQPFSEAHFATFPPTLIRRPILASTRPGDVVLDPFGGSGTTGMVALEEGRSAILCELNPAYADMAATRTTTTPGLGL